MSSPGIDWKNQIVAFLSTMAGIFIALNLDQCQQDRETSRRLAEYMTLLDDEIKRNVANLDTLLVNGHKHELQLRFLVASRIDEGIKSTTEDHILYCNKQEIDSVAKVWYSNPFLIDYRDVGEGRFSAIIAFSIFRYDYQSTVWESFKSTDLINQLAPESITKYTRLYAEFSESKKALNDHAEIIRMHVDNGPTGNYRDFIGRLASLHHARNLDADRNMEYYAVERGQKYKFHYNENGLEPLLKKRDSTYNNPVGN